MDMYKKLKQLKGERFARIIRNHHNGILEIPDLDLILRHAGHDAERLLPWLETQIGRPRQDDTPAEPPRDPFALLDQAGYNAFYADTLEKQNSIQPFFQKGELLCTFNDHARYQKYYIVHAVKKNVDEIRREDFRGKERREDAYGTSVISIQMLKTGAFISIKNRYNTAVDACDNTFGSDPDQIAPGLSAALKHYFNVDFTPGGTTLPDGFLLTGNRIFKYHLECNNIYYGDQAWALNNEIHKADRAAGDALFGQFVFDNKSKILRKIDPALEDSFADDFNRCYGGNKGLCVQNGNLTLKGSVLIGAVESRIKTINLPALTVTGESCLRLTTALTHFEAPSLVKTGNHFLADAYSLTHFSAPSLVRTGNSFLARASLLTHFSAPALLEVGDKFLGYAHRLTHFNAPALHKAGKDCLNEAAALVHFNAPALLEVGDHCLAIAIYLTHFNAPVLIKAGDDFLTHATRLTHFSAPALREAGDRFLAETTALTDFSAPALREAGDNFLAQAAALTDFNAPALHKAGDCFLIDATVLTHFDAPVLREAGNHFLAYAVALTDFNAPALREAGDYFLACDMSVTDCYTPALMKVGQHSSARFSSLTFSKSRPPYTGCSDPAATSSPIIVIL